LALGSDNDAGNTTCVAALVYGLRMAGRTVIALKATGTAAVSEIAAYTDFGAAQALDCVDFGLPTTYPIGRKDIENFLSSEIDYCLAQPVDAVVMECAGDLSPATRADSCRMSKRGVRLIVVLAANDTLERWAQNRRSPNAGLNSLITGPALIPYIAPTGSPCEVQHKSACGRQQPSQRD
jgi:hypothetical protein